jgi:hypothetical protein
MKDDRLPKIVLFDQPLRVKGRAGRPRLGWEDVIKKDLKETETSWKGVNREGLNRLGRKRSARCCLCSCFGCLAWCCDELLVVVVALNITNILITNNKLLKISVLARKYYGFC